VVKEALDMLPEGVKNPHFALFCALNWVFCQHLVKGIGNGPCQLSGSPL
jgi:hypothetical protein